MSNYHQISFAQAASYLHNYLQNPALFKTATDQSLGATIPLTIFNNALNPTEHGVAFWFCWDKDGAPRLPPFFMAFELNRFIASNNPPISILHDQQQMPMDNCMFTYPNPAPPSLPETELFLQNHTSLPSPIGTQSIAKADTTALNDSYMQDFPDGAAHPEFRKVNCCFFSSKDVATGHPDIGFDAFVNQKNIRYVRYYFSLVRSDSGIVSPKLILFGVDSKGKNLVERDDIVMEVSWP